MKARYKYRFYPTIEQKQKLAQLFGCTRVVWNDALALCKSLGKALNYRDLCKQLTQTKQTEERQWLKDISAVPLQQSLKNLSTAYKNYFNSCKGRRKGSKVNPPKFKKRSNKQTATFTKSGFQLKANNGSAFGTPAGYHCAIAKIYIAKIGHIKPVWSRKLPSIPTSVTIIKDSAERYFVSFVVEIKPEKLPDNDTSIGIDLGITDFATFSNGEKIKAPKPLKKRLKRLRRLQRNLVRKNKGSNRREKARKRAAKLHARIKDTRSDFLHKLSTRIIRENQTIVLEDLNVSGMVKNRKLSRAISDLGWRSFRTMLEAKAAMYGREFRVIDRWEPTTQKCHECGFKGGKKELSVREWTCLNCGAVHDRDINAAVNILVAGGHPETINGRGRKHKTTTVAAPVETSTQLEPVQLRCLGR